MDALHDFAALFAALTDTECDFLDSPFPHLDDGFALRDAARDALAPSAQDSAAPDSPADSAGVVYGRGPAMWTGSGYLHVLDPRPEEIRLGEISRALSRLPRFGGHTSYLWTVGAHSILCERIAEARGLGLEMRRLALMHDATEAYLGDLVRPLKVELPRYQEIEARLWAVIRERFDLDWSADAAAEVKRLDNLALAIEKRDLCPGAPAWPGLPEPSPNFACAPMTPAQVDRVFLAQAADLGLA